MQFIYKILAYFSHLGYSRIFSLLFAKEFGSSIPPVLFFFHGIVGSFTIYTVLYDSQGEKILTASNITHSLWKTKVAISQHFYFQISYNSSKCFLWLLFNRTSSLIDWLIHSFKSNLKHLKHTKHSIMVLEYGEK